MNQQQVDRGGRHQPGAHQDRGPSHDVSANCTRGMVTAELAVGILAATILTTLLCWAVSLVVVQTRCADVAAQMARQLARGDQPGAEQARQQAPRGALVTVTRNSGQIHVEVISDASLGPVGPVTLIGRAAVVIEPGSQP